MLQLVEVMPCLDKLSALLGRPYSLDDEDTGELHQQQQAAGGQEGEDGMDVDMTDAAGAAAGGGRDDVDAADMAAGAGPGSSRTNRPPGCYTLEELLQQMQVGVLAGCFWCAVHG